MPCFHPLDARRSPGGSIAFKAMTPFDTLLKLPCGRCIGCKLERSRQWALRLMHEAQLHNKTSFVTLTYRDECLPSPRREFAKPHRAAGVAPGSRTHAVDSSRTRETRTHENQELASSLSRIDLQLFTKRLHMATLRRFGKGVRYFACGEYGERTNRPHYHIAVYGEDFSDDRRKWKRSNGHQLWRSSRLHELWPHGDADIGELTFESAAYIARYITKKITGEKAMEHYRRTDTAGNDYWLEPEFSVMSRRPGIGKEWFEQYNTSVYPHDRVIARGHPSKPPRYYDQLLAALRPHELEAIKQARQQAAQNSDNSPERLRAGEAILRARLSQRKRPLE